MSEKNKSKLVIRIGEIQIEGDDLGTALGEKIVAKLMKKLNDLKDDLAEHGIETTITSINDPLDADESKASK